MDSPLLSEAIDRIQAGQYGEVHSLLIYKDGQLVFEECFPGHTYKVVSIVMGFLPSVTTVETHITLLSIGLFALALAALQKEG